jgi:hypothetical protein
MHKLKKPLIEKQVALIFLRLIFNQSLQLL